MVDPVTIKLFLHVLQVTSKIYSILHKITNAPEEILVLKGDIIVLSAVLQAIDEQMHYQTSLQNNQAAPPACLQVALEQTNKRLEELEKQAKGLAKPRWSFTTFITRVEYVVNHDQIDKARRNIIIAQGALNLALSLNLTAIANYNNAYRSRTIMSIIRGKRRRITEVKEIEIATDVAAQLERVEGSASAEIPVQPADGKGYDLAEFQPKTKLPEKPKLPKSRMR